MTMVDDETIQRLWKLTNELSAQTASNRELNQSLKAQVVDVKTRAERKIFDGELDEEDDGLEGIGKSHSFFHSLADGTYELICYSIDGTIPTDQTSTFAASGPASNPALLRKYQELQRQHKAVVTQNQFLEQENAQLQVLVKDYEAGLEIVTKKFRTHTHAAQQSKFLMQRDYEALLEEERRTTSTILADNLAMQHSLSQLAALIRQAYDADNDLPSNTLVEQLLVENQSLREMLGITEQGNSDSSRSPITSTVPAYIQRGPPRREGTVMGGPVRDYFADEEMEGAEGRRVQQQQLQQQQQLLQQLQQQQQQQQQQQHQTVNGTQTANGTATAALELGRTEVVGV
ncbi:hypothetical protein BC937DRAFT_89619 [Endogone sp. FLAS-F59071]|nr:hypothetical protein BC937DRAFT_89619 [Endogone sp. FLAS-F59071]|eukprot:RUS22346.1 hypothetical protein BC937DRAFT_89619 [Endogone sp. FLAS-F59071]